MMTHGQTPTSGKTPTSRTTLTGFITSAPMFKSRSAIFFRLAFDPNQISSVFCWIQLKSSRFAPFLSCFNATLKFIMVPGMPGSVVCSIIWVSSGYMWWIRQYSSMNQWLVWGRPSNHQKTCFNFPRDRKLPLIWSLNGIFSKWKRQSLWLNGMSQNVATGWLST